MPGLLFLPTLGAKVKTLHLYLTRQVLATLAMTVFVFTLVLLLGNVIKEILALLINRQATLGLALRAIALLIPYVLAFSLPMGMLTAALLVFGRFSADHELTAVRASGISLVSLIGPVILVSAGLSAFCAWLNFDLAPASRTAYRALLFRAGLKRAGGVLLSNQDMQFGSYIIFAGKVHKDQTNLDNVYVTERNEKGELVWWAHARTGDIATDLAQQKIFLTLHDTSYAEIRDARTGWEAKTPAGGDLVLPIEYGAQERQTMTVPLSDMTFAQLRAELSRCAGESASAPAPPRNATTAELRTMQERLRQMKGDVMTPVLVYLNRDVSFSFACIGFALIGVPLGIRAHRRETSVGAAVALVLILIYYSFIVLGQAWENHPERFPQLIVWVPNFVFQAVGSVLLWRSNQGR